MTTTESLLAAGLRERRMPCMGCNDLDCADCFSQKIAELGYVKFPHALIERWRETARTRGFDTYESQCAEELEAALRGETK